MKKWYLNKAFVMVMILMAISSLCRAQSRGDDFGIFLETELSKSNVVVGEPVIASLWLYAPVNVEINHIKSLGNASYGSCDTRVATGTQNAHVVEQVNSKGVSYNKIIVTQMVLYPTESGNFQVCFPDIQVGVVAGREYDPFWGMPTRVRTTPLRFADNVHREKVKVKDISKNKPADFSNAVGTFSVEADLPPGEIVKGNDISLIYTVKGVGSLEDFKFPDLSKLMPQGIDVKSVKPSERCYIKDGNVHCEITYMVTFVPHVLGEVSIPALSFTFYDVDQKRYRTLSSKPVSFEVLEPKVREKPAEPVYI